METVQSESVPFSGFNPPEIHFIRPVRRRKFFSEINGEINFFFKSDQNVGDIARNLGSTGYPDSRYMKSTVNAP